MKDKRYYELEKTVLCLRQDVALHRKRLERIEGITRGIAKDIAHKDPELALIIQRLLDGYSDLNQGEDQ